jgi:hypothetical protein
MDLVATGGSVLLRDLLHTINGSRNRLSRAGMYSPATFGRGAGDRVGIE